MTDQKPTNPYFKTVKRLNAKTVLLYANVPPAYLRALRERSKQVSAIYGYTSPASILITLTLRHDPELKKLYEQYNDKGNNKHVKQSTPTPKASDFSE